MKQLIDSKTLTKKELERIFRVTDLMRIRPLNHAGKILGTIFWEPSTRTRISMEAAMLKIGGNYITCTKAGSSGEKGESFTDTVATVSQYADILAVRHASEVAIIRAAEICKVPIINCGCGSTDHPTQAIIDLYTILRAKGQINGLRILVIGDLQYARTIKSLLHLLKLYDAVVWTLSSSADLTNAEWQSHLLNADVLYMTRLHNEREPEGSEKRTLKFVLNSQTIAYLKKDSIVLHPLPRTAELLEEVDNDERAKYFEQVENGLYVRMAILQIMMEK